jgi:tRNA G26 N,N-dimethylase Trm1
MKSVRPVLSVYSDFYIRVFFKVVESKSECLEFLNKTAIVFNCETCTNFHIQPFGKIKKTKNSKGNDVEKRC